MAFRWLFCIGHSEIGAATAVVLANGLLMIFGIINITRVHMTDAKWQVAVSGVGLVVGSIGVHVWREGSTSSTRMAITLLHVALFLSLVAAAAWLAVAVHLMANGIGPEGGARVWIVLMFVFMILAAVDLAIFAQFAWTGARELRSPELPQHDTQKHAKQPLNETASLVGGGNVAGPPNRCCAVM